MLRKQFENDRASFDRLERMFRIAFEALETADGMFSKNHAGDFDCCNKALDAIAEIAKELG